MTDWKSIMLLVLAFLFVLFLNGAIPFIAMPTLGQSVWTTGFSLSFVNQSIFSIYANNFGAPEPAGIAFGLAGAYPAALLIFAGLHPADAYSIMSALWLGLAFFGAWRIGLLSGLTDRKAVFGAVLWLSMPIVIEHVRYSMLSLGIALLPFYFWSALRLFTFEIVVSRTAVQVSMVYVIACIIAVFMDGYSFMMYAVGSTIIAIYVFIRFHELRIGLIKFAFPVHVLGFSLAYLLYLAYIGKPQFEASPLDFFRGWGLDITFLLIPTQGKLWLWDTLGLSIPRSNHDYFGDASVWITTFSLPLIVAGVISWWFVKKKHKLATGFLILVVFSIWMAMGPSVKINSTKPEPMGGMMPAELALAPTGNALLSKYLPGFKNMRASYRWAALGFFGLWALLLLFFAQSKSRRLQMLSAAFLFALIMSNIPNLDQKWNEYVNNRDSFYQIDKDLVSPLSQDLYKNELVAFLPYRNDFLVNYLASKLNIRSYNIGGDKNLTEARKHWPKIMQRFRMGGIDPDFADQVLLILAKAEADVVILPYIDLLWAAHHWPAPAKFNSELLPIIDALAASGYVDVTERAYYTVIRLKKVFQKQDSGERLQKLMANRCMVPVCLKRDKFTAGMTNTQVGEVKDDILNSTGRKGFLLYGPYLSMLKGRYLLHIYGAASKVGRAWIDVVSEKGNVRHAKFQLISEHSSISEVLLIGEVTLENDIHDIEIRVFVDEEDEIQLYGYKLIPVKDELASTAVQ